MCKKVVKSRQFGPAIENMRQGHNRRISHGLQPSQSSCAACDGGIMHSFRNPNIGIMVLDWRLKYPPLLMNKAGMEKMRRIEKAGEEHLLLKISSSLIRFDFISQFDQGSLNTEREAAEIFLFEIRQSTFENVQGRV